MFQKARPNNSPRQVNLSDSTTEDLTTQVTWASSATSVATISNATGSNGLATAVSQGTSTITATLSGISGSTVMTVSAPVLQSIVVAPANPNVPKGETEQFHATGTFSDHSTSDISSQVNWTSSATAIATISNTTGTQGLATAVALGSSTITATLNGINGTTSINVTSPVLASISVSPATPSVPKGETEQFHATGTFSDSSTQDLTNQVTWASATPAVATISNTSGSKGLATAVALGTSQITATMGTINGSTVMTVAAPVLASIAVSPSNPSVPQGSPEQFSALGTFSDNSTSDVTSQVTWASSDQTVATISNSAGSQGLATTLKVGTTSITATSGAISASTVLTVTASLVSITIAPESPSVPKGETEQFTATGNLSDSTTEDLTTQVTWASSATSVATVSNATGSNGLATAVSQGTSTITATLSGISGSTVMTVSAPVLQSIVVAPANPNVPKGETEQFHATGTFSDHSTSDISSQVNWTSSATAIATISNTTGTQGLATAVALGSSTITATLNGINGTTSINVTSPVLASISVSPATPSVPKGETEQFHATGTFSDSSTEDLTKLVSWSSSIVSVATISNSTGSQGLARATGAGNTNVIASYRGVTGSTVLTVTPAVLLSIAVSPASPSVNAGQTDQLTATGTFSDGSKQNLTGQVTWTSSATAVASISSAGLATAVSAGSAAISATLNGVSGTAPISVPAPPPALVTVTRIVVVKNKKHLVAQIEVFFSAVVEAAQAANPLAYILKTPGKKNSFTAKNAKTIKLKSARYTPASNEVVLTPKAAFALSKPVQLTVEGTGPSGLRDSLGRFIDGNDDSQAGGNRVVIITRKGVTVSS